MCCSPILPNYSMEIGCQRAETLLQLGKTGLQRGKTLRRLLQLGKTGLTVVLGAFGVANATRPPILT
ncbi:hypothetical protein, partial [Paenibacillus aestuarii]|uniref:hypothetical protein n=1 Tax=Paenibacillus aestuarii TaxID=516965 RepID=UPI0022E9A550